MFLRAVSVRGFKSFAEKAVLRFEPGITVIVGPNGSGKSNITDGILWALGEQRAGALRGSSMEDVIFSGTASKKALGAAEVSLTLDNTDGRIPIEFSEVTVTRRLYRSGESEYLLNRTPCRLIDIQEILSDSGLGREMYSIISQGRLDDMLNCKPQERRQLLEEAAGVLKHKRRRDRALRKLGAMEQNLTRGKDILREVNRQLTPLQKQAELAREHLKLASELKEAQVAGAVGRLRLLRGQWENLAGDHAEKTGRIDEVNLNLKQAQERIDELETELEGKGALTGDISEYRRRFAGLGERINSGLLLLEEKGKNLIAKISELRQAIHSLDSRVAAARKEQTSLLDEKQELDDELAKLYQRLNQERREAENVKKAGKKTVEDFTEAEGRLNKARLRRTEVEREIDRRRSLLESTTEKISFLREQLAAVTQKREALAAELAVVEEEHGQLEAGRPEADRRAEEGLRRVEECRRLKDVAAGDLERAASALGEARAKTAALEAMDAGARRDFSWFETERDGFPGISDSVGSAITVDAKYEKALESVLGFDANAFIAADRPVASLLYARARERGDDPVRVLTIGAPVDMPDDLGPGVRRASEVVACSEAARPAVEALLGHVWVADDLADFIEGRRQAPPGSLVVDPAGDYVEGRGLIVRQQSGDLTRGPLATRRELSVLKHEIENHTSAAQSARAALDAAEAEITTVEKEARLAQTESQKLDSRIVGVALRAQNVRRDVDSLREQEAEIGAGLLEKEAVVKEAEAGLAQLEGELDAAAAETAGAEAEYAAKRAAQAESVEAEKRATAGLSEAQVSMASLTERQRHLKTRLIAVTDELDRAEKICEQQKRMVGATEELRHRVQPVHDLYTGLRLASEERATQLEAMDGLEQAGAATLREELRELHQRARDLAADLNLANSELLAMAESKSQVEAEVNQITRMLVDELGVALETALAQADDGREPEDWAARERRLRERLSRIGPVNQIAAGEFAKLEERQAFLSKQIDDLVGSHKALRKVIKAIDTKIRDRFQASFDEINVNFQQVFEELFPGGTARLVLVADEDAEKEPGVGIEAQPQGKRLQSLSLLSGGERSLVGLALMFAIHAARPSPFYILDEVEAALDVINLQRFIELMKKLKTKTQFLVVTHQRPTMEIADCVYGVSMQADGVSKVISQKLEPGELDDGRREENGLVATAVGRPEEVEDQP